MMFSSDLSACPNKAMKYAPLASLAAPDPQSLRRLGCFALYPKGFAQSGRLLRRYVFKRESEI